MPFQKRLLNAFSVLAISACTSYTPPLARDLPRSFVSTGDFDSRIQQRFPAGSEERLLVDELKQERFKIDQGATAAGAYRHFASYTRQELACRTSWQVLWNEEQGRIAKIEGRYSGEICL